MSNGAPADWGVTRNSLMKRVLRAVEPVLTMDFFRIGRAVDREAKSGMADDAIYKAIRAELRGVESWGKPRIREVTDAVKLAASTQRGPLDDNDDDVSTVAAPGDVGNKTWLRRVIVAILRAEAMLLTAATPRSEISVAMPPLNTIVHTMYIIAAQRLHASPWLLDTRAPDAFGRQRRIHDQSPEVRTIVRGAIEDAVLDIVDMGKVADVCMDDPAQPSAPAPTQLPSPVATATATTAVMDTATVAPASVASALQPAEAATQAQADLGESVAARAGATADGEADGESTTARAVETSDDTVGNPPTLEQVLNRSAPTERVDDDAAPVEAATTAVGASELLSQIQQMRQKLDKVLSLQQPASAQP